MSLIDIYAPLGGSDKFPIQRNYIAVNSRSTPIHGIYARDNCSRFDISSNDVYYLGTPAPSEVTATLGIAIENVNGESNRVDSNTIVSSFWPNAEPEEQTSYIKCGIHLYNSPNFQVCSNTLNDTYRAFHMSGYLDYCDFAKNNIDRHFHGLHCIKWQDGVATQMGQQDWHANVWSASAGDYVGHAARYEDGTPGFIFRVDDAFQGHMPPSVNVSNWFYPETTGESNSNCVDESRPPFPGITDADERVMDESYPVESVAGQWDLERELLLKLLTYPELMPNSSAAETWYDGKVNSSAWKFAKARKAFLDAFNFPTNLQSEVNGLYTDLSALWEHLLELDSLQRVEPNSIDPTILQQQDSATAEFVQLRDDVENVLADCKAFSESGLEEAEDLNDNLPRDAAYEANLKGVYEIAVKAARGDSLTEADYDALRDIAIQCPLEGGSAVRIAPYRLPHAEAVTYLREEQGEEACESAERQQAIGYAKAIEIRTSPNPTNDMLTVLMSEAIAGRWRVYELTGNLLREAVIPPHSFSFSIPLGDIAGGIYFLHLMDEWKQAHVRKFIVIH